MGWSFVVAYACWDDKHYENLFQYQDYHIIVGKLYSRVALILGGLRCVLVFFFGGGVRKGGSIHSAIKMNMVQE